jgi:hypothetical protein
MCDECAFCGWALLCTKRVFCEDCAGIHPVCEICAGQLADDVEGIRLVA